MGAYFSSTKYNEESLKETIESQNEYITSLHSTIKLLQHEKNSTHYLNPLIAPANPAAPIPNPNNCCVALGGGVD